MLRASFWFLFTEGKITKAENGAWDEYQLVYFSSVQELIPKENPKIVEGLREMMGNTFAFMRDFTEEIEELKMKARTPAEHRNVGAGMTINMPLYFGEWLKKKGIDLKGRVLLGRGSTTSTILGASRWRIVLRYKYYLNWKDKSLALLLAFRE